MNFTCVAVLLPSMFLVAQSAECNNDFIFSTAGWNVSLEWRLMNKSSSGYRSASFIIFDSSENRIAEMRGLECNVYNQSSNFCNISDRDNEMIAYLTLLNVTTRHSGIYTLRLKMGLDEKCNSSKTLVVIEKPKIKEVGKPILSRRFEMTCDSSHGLKCLIYKWRINGTHTTHLFNGSKCSISSLQMTDNFSHITCRVCLKKIASNFSEPDSCSADSDPYTIQVIYGPDNISLSLSESNFDIEEHAKFTIDCFASCNPNCKYFWKGRDTTQSKTLVITSFEKDDAGNYTCYVTNQETNQTLNSNSIILHVKEKHEKEDMEVIGVGLIGVAVLLVVIGFLLVVQWRRSSSNQTDSRTMNQQGENIRTPTDGEMLKGISKIQKRPLPVPNTTCRRPYRPIFANHKRRSRSLHNLYDTAHDAFYPLTGGLSLQLLYSHSIIMGTNRVNGKRDNDSIKKRRFSDCEDNQLNNISDDEDGIKQEFMYEKDRKEQDKKTDRDKHNSSTNSESLINLRHEIFEQEPQENLYSTINEDALSVYDNASTSENSNEEHMNTRYGESDYDLPISKNI